MNKKDYKKIDLRDANLEDANLIDAYLIGAYLKGADLVFSCWPLHCGSIGVKVDDRILSQLYFHVSRVDVSSCSALVKYAHRLIFSSWAGRLMKNLFCDYRKELKEI